MAITEREQKVFNASYVETLLWSSVTGEAGDPVNEIDWVKDADDALDLFPHTSKNAMFADCKAFTEDNEEDLRAAMEADPHYDFGRAGHDFALTRNGHGAGFWDRGLGEVGQRLTDAAKVYGSMEVDVVGPKMLGLSG